MRPARWNFFFCSCRAVSLNGAAVMLPTGHGMVEFGELKEAVFFPSQQREFRLVPGEVARLEKLGSAERYGLVRKEEAS